MIVALIQGSSIWAICIGSGMSEGVVQLLHAAVGARDVVNHRRRRRDQVEVEFARQPLLDDLQMQQSQKPAAKAEAQRRRAFGLVMEACIVQAQLAQAVAQLFEVIGIHREQPAPDHGESRAEACQGLARRPAVIGDGVATSQSATVLMAALI